jgi:hypothetical protein
MWGLATPTSRRWQKLTRIALRSKSDYLSLLEPKRFLTGTPRGHRFATRRVDLDWVN